MTSNTVEGIDSLGDSIDANEIAVITKSVVYARTSGGGYMVEFQASTTIANTAVSLRFSLIEVKNL